MARQSRGAGALALAVLIVVEAMLLVGVSAGPAAAQLFDDRSPFQNPFGNPFQRQRQYRQPQQQDFWNPFAPQQQQQEPRQQSSAPAVDNSKAPAPKKPETPPSTNVLVFGDSMADWLGYGLEQSFAESPEMGVIRKPRTYSGLIRQDVRTDPRGDHPDWPKLIRETLSTEKPDYIVMMIGLNDRRPIREIRQPTPAAAKPGQPGQPAQPGQPGQPAGQPAQPGQAAQTPAPTEEAPADQPAESQSQQAAAAPASSGSTHEFRTDRWSELYIRRIDETIAALKSKGVPVFWVGLPPVKGAKSTADFSYLNDLFRSRAERAGIIFVDVWDGFVDEGGRFATSGPDVEGQIRRLRAADGVHFTQAGARKLAHYVERELQRVMTVRGAPVAMPMPVPAEEPPAAKPSEPAKGPAGPTAPTGTPRPMSGPVITLTAGPAAIEPDDALLGAPKQTQTAALDVVAAKVIQKGEAMPAPAGRADDFAWPRRDLAPVGADPVVAFTTLPLMAMKSEKQPGSDAPAPSGGGTAAAAPPKPSSAPSSSSGPRVASRSQSREPQQQGGFGWFGQPYQQQRQYQQQQRPTFFPFLFGGGR